MYLSFYFLMKVKKINMRLAQDEKEFSVLVNGSDNTIAEVFTDNPTWVRRLNKRFTPYKIDGISHFYRVPTNKIIRVSFLTNGTGEEDLSLSMDDDE